MCVCLYVLWEDVGLITIISVVAFNKILSVSVSQILSQNSLSICLFMSWAHSRIELHDSMVLLPLGLDHVTSSSQICMCKGDICYSDWLQVSLDLCFALWFEIVAILIWVFEWLRSAAKGKGEKKDIPIWMQNSKEEQGEIRKPSSVISAKE